MAPGALSRELVDDSSSDESSIAPKLKATNGKSKLKSKESSKVSVEREASESDKSSESGSESESGHDTSLSSSSASDTELPTMTSVVSGSKRKSDYQSQNEPQATKSSTKRSKASKHPSHIPAYPYHPPAGYEPFTASDSDRAPLSIFDSSTISAKQIWHITAPADVSLKSIKTLDIAAALRGEPVLEHKGRKYNMHAMPTKSQRLLLATTNNQGTDGLQYTNIEVPITRDLFLREIGQVQSEVTRKGGEDEISSQPTSSQDERSVDKTNGDSQGRISFFASAEGKGKEPRQQPKGLLMRYHPYGSNVSRKENMTNPDFDGSEMGDARGDERQGDKFIAPPPALDTDEEEITATTPKKEKKSKNKDKSKQSKSSQQSASRDVDVMDIDSPPEKRKKKKDRREKV